MSVIKDISQLKANGYNSSSIDEAIEWNARWEAFHKSPIGPFLATGDSQELWRQPDGPLFDIETVARNVEELVPDAILFKYGLLPVWTSVGGNVIAYHPETKAFYWADQSCIFSDDCVLIPNTYEELPLTFENLMKSLIRLSEEECGTYLRNLRDGLYDAEIDKLD